MRLWEFVSMIVTLVFFGVAILALCVALAVILGGR